MTIPLTVIYKPTHFSSSFPGGNAILELHVVCSWSNQDFRTISL